MKKYKGQLQIGSLDSKKAAAPAPAPAKKEAPKPKAPVAVSPTTGGAQEPYGDMIPFADPAWYHGVSYLLGLYLVVGWPG